ncbi:hypothetical protein CBM2597_U10043 [Cupriavidus taiwanensis]|uniref:Uncharacterized protein n=1 Tax=Cupriavidus taiwanensis TaxID=164546 RepID=A0A7Z7NQZ2_9BURK|nr:hypothetical protein CBM2597_U10043 [Cupriavidus taiwanensis]SPC25549.1 hypothetical protein CBM2594_U10050 [Cupriavidus taiwanensis]
MDRFQEVCSVVLGVGQHPATRGLLPRPALRLLCAMKQGGQLIVVAKLAIVRIVGNVPLRVVPSQEPHVGVAGHTIAMYIETDEADDAVVRVANRFEVHG